MMRLLGYSYYYLFVLLLVQVGHYGVIGQACDARSGKCDTHERCPVWASEGECEESASYMRTHCPGSCAGRKKQRQAQKQLEEEEVCEDELDRCEVFAELGECETNPEKMHKYCRLSCGICQGAVCEDNHERCAFWAESGECDNNPVYMHEHCAMSCQTCKNVAARDLAANVDAVRSASDSLHDHTDLLKKTKKFGEEQRAEGDQALEVIARIKSTIAYLESEDVKKLPKSLRMGCVNKHDLCTFWQVVGECENNMSYMTTNCAPACHTCHLIDFNNRCPPLPEGTLPALEPGDLDAMFSRIISTAPGNQTNTSVNPEMPPYTVHVHSSPDDNGRPWVITFENFVTAEEADALIQHGHDEGYKRSEDVGQKKADGSYDSVKSSGRTSENAWCSEFHGCRAKEVPKRIHDRISAVLGIPPENSEDMQLLRYEPGQFYNVHHDYIEHQKSRNCGPRILTFFLYLSDVEAGGGTEFPDLGITVMPKRGRALLWPSVLNDDPMEKDGRMRHQALPVEKGTKFAANAWIHMYDYMKPQKAGCT